LGHLFAGCLQEKPAAPVAIYLHKLLAGIDALVCAESGCLTRLAPAAPAVLLVCLRVLQWFAASISCSTSAQEPLAAATTPAAAAAAEDTAATTTGGPPSTSAPASKQPHQQLRYTLK
jgi:hypothetical protein